MVEPSASFVVAMTLKASVTLTVTVIISLVTVPLLSFVVTVVVAVLDSSKLRTLMVMAVTEPVV